MFDLNELNTGLGGTKGPAILLYPSPASSSALISELPFSLILFCLDPIPNLYDALPPWF